MGRAPKTVRLKKDERKAIEDILEREGNPWYSGTDFVHEAIREKLHREGKRLRGSP